MRNVILLVSAALVLLFVNLGIWQREQLLSRGRMVLLELAPVDPRSLMQGDYLALRFRVTGDAFPLGVEQQARDGRLVLAVDGRNVATFRRLADGRAPAADEALLRYRIRNHQAKLATNTFFFQENKGELYRDARYGEFRVAPDGDALLVALRDAQLQRVGSEGQAP